MYLTIQQLATETGVSINRIHKLVHRGILPRPTGGRRFARYGDEHVRRLRALKAERDRRTTFPEYAERWNGVPEAHRVHRRHAPAGARAALA